MQTNSHCCAAIGTLAVLSSGIAKTVADWVIKNASFPEERSALMPNSSDARSVRVPPRFQDSSLMLNRNLNLLLLAILSPVLFSGCWLCRSSADHEHLTACQLRSQELYAENEQMMMAQQQQQQTIAGLEQDRQSLAQQLDMSAGQLATANSRIDNLLAERSTLKDRYAQVLTDTTTDSFNAGIPGGELSGFEFDPLTGLNKFPEDILFDLGSAELRPEAIPVLKEFVNNVKSESSSGLRVLIVGHTDDQQILRESTARKHPTNWHLSTDRADQVIVELERMGVAPERMSAMGYSRFQPLEISTDETARQRNRRVELYVVPESANLTAWDPVRALK